MLGSFPGLIVILGAGGKRKKKKKKGRGFCWVQLQFSCIPFWMKPGVWGLKKERGLGQVVRSVMFPTP